MPQKATLASFISPNAFAALSAPAGGYQPRLAGNPVTAPELSGPDFPALADFHGLSGPTAAAAAEIPPLGTSAPPASPREHADGLRTGSLRLEPALPERGAIDKACSARAGSYRTPPASSDRAGSADAAEHPAEDSPGFDASAPVPVSPWGTPARRRDTRRKAPRFASQPCACDHADCDAKPGLAATDEVVGALQQPSERARNRNPHLAATDEVVGALQAASPNACDAPPSEPMPPRSGDPAAVQAIVNGVDPNNCVSTVKDNVGGIFNCVCTVEDSVGGIVNCVCNFENTIGSIYTGVYVDGDDDDDGLSLSDHGLPEGSMTNAPRRRPRGRV